MTQYERACLIRGDAGRTIRAILDRIGDKWTLLIVTTLDGPALRFSEHMSGANGEAMFRHACAMGLEGIVSKRATSRYKSGSCVNWVKVKNPAYERRANPSSWVALQ